MSLARLRLLHGMEVPSRRRGSLGDGVVNGSIELIGRRVRLHQKSLRPHCRCKVGHRREGETSKHDDGDRGSVAIGDEVDQDLKTRHIRQRHFYDDTIHTLGPA